MSSSERPYPKNDRQLKEQVLEWVEDLRSEAADQVILVEGKKDVEALRTLDIEHVIVDINRGMNMFDLIEGLKNGNLSDLEGPFTGKVIILTDWDRRGGMLASRLRKAALHFDLDVDLDHRKQLAWTVGKWIKDVESLPGFLAGLDAGAHLT